MSLDLANLHQLETSLLDTVSQSDINTKSIFSNRSQARLYGSMLILLKNASKDTLSNFVDFITDRTEPGGPINDDKKRSGCLFNRSQYMKCLQHMISLFFVDIGCQNNAMKWQVRHIIEYIIQTETQECKTVEALLESDLLNLVWTQICSDGLSKQPSDFIQYLYKELLSEKFDLASISQTPAESLENYNSRVNFAKSQKKEIGVIENENFKSFSLAFSSMYEAENDDETLELQQKLAELVGLIWDELYTSDQARVKKDNLDGPIDARAKCKMIPVQIKFFCQTLYSSVKQKFPDRAEGVISEFLFDKWLLKALCDDGDRNGLTGS